MLQRVVAKMWVNRAATPRFLKRRYSYKEKLATRSGSPQSFSTDVSDVQFDVFRIDGKRIMHPVLGRVSLVHDSPKQFELSQRA